MYINHLREQSKSIETVKTYLHPIRLGTRMMMRRDEKQKDLFQHIRLDGRGFKPAKTKAVIDLPKVLTFAQWFEKKGRWQQALCIKLCGLSAQFKKFVDAVDVGDFL